MESANIGKRLLYGFASGLFIGLALPIFVVSEIISGPPTWFNWLLPLFFALAFWFGYTLPSTFEKVFAQGLESSARLDPKLAVAAQNVRKADLQRKMPISLGWFFFLYILACFILLFTRFVNIVPYIFVVGFFLFMFLGARNYNKNQ